jgi:hypothetical protein
VGIYPGGDAPETGARQQQIAEALQQQGVQDYLTTH